ncbi:phosphotransferase enzyme family protein [Phycicoccus flavus]|uniref:phosphotransferase enzyme family protein n=1 Tax=Phycicoccus flavus TaxID=2502783 RepID=UPI000FEC1088|nr:phosphotransferase [Phycicoccus flavus]NHA67634.1 phosphotransferase [Phycicoccus flavus]
MTASAAFADLGTDAQVDLLRGVATAAAPHFGLDVERLELVLHGFNTTFEVTARDGRHVALRVNTNSLATPEHLTAQLAWVHAIARDTGVGVPDPVPTLTGAPFTTVASAAAGRDFLVVAHAWLEGPDVEECDAEQAHALGEAMATLHLHAARWRLPEGTSLPLFAEPLLGDADRISTVDVPGPGGRAVLDTALGRARAAFDTVLAGAEPVVVHGDLHGGNLKWHEGRLAVFDFDDAGLAVPALDLAVATFYLRDAEGVPAEAAVRAGYAQVAPLPDLDPEVFEALVASRQLLLANSLLTSSTPEFRAMLPEYLGRTVTRLRHWLDTGRFVLDPPER